MKTLNGTKMFWITTAAVFGSLLLLGFVAPPGSGGDLGTGRAEPASATADPTAVAEEVQQYTCADGESRDMAITVTGSEFSAVGELTSITPNGMTVRALPGQLVLAPPMEGSAAHGYLAGDVVTATGVITADGTYQALQIAPACGGALVTEITPQPTVATEQSAPVVATLDDNDTVVLQPYEDDDDGDDGDDRGPPEKDERNKYEEKDRNEGRGRGNNDD